MPVFRSGDRDPGGKPAGKAPRSGEAKQDEPSNGRNGGDPAEAAASEPRNRLQEQAASSPRADDGTPSSPKRAAPDPAPSLAAQDAASPQSPEPARPWSLLGEINSSVSEAGARTENRILRGLMALDERIAGRQLSMEDALGVVLQDHARTMETVRKEIAAGSDRTVERIALLEERTYETLSTFIAVLQQIRAELSVLSDTIKALEIETNLVKRARSGGPG